MLPSRLFFEDLLGSVDESSKMKCDIYEKDNTFYVEMDIPGFTKDDISIQINKGTLTISVVKEEEEINQDKKYLRKERRIYGKYERSFYLGDIDEDNIEASFNDGILKIAVPKKVEEITKKTIEIK